MDEPNDLNRPGKVALWTGRVLSALPVLMLLMSATMKLMKAPVVVESWKHLGWPEHVGLAIGILELTCTILYAIPATSIIGAILLTGYLGGAIATHYRIGETPNIATITLLGVVIWLGLFLREPRLRRLVPFRR